MGLTRSFLPFEEHYTQIRNAHLRDVRISRRARGLLAEVMTHRVGWRVSVSGLQKVGPEGRDAIRSTIEELRNAGYLVRIQDRGERGRFGEVEYAFRDPFDADGNLIETDSTADGNSGSGGFTGDGQPDVGQPDVGESDTKEEHPLEDHLEEDQEEEHPMFDLAVPDPEMTLDEGFDRMWQAWPTSASKQTARMAFEKALRTFTTSRRRAGMDEIVGGVCAWAQGYGAKKDAGQWQPNAPYLATFLNGHRWIESPPVLDAVEPAGYDRDSPTARAAGVLAIGDRLMEQQTKGIEQ